ncbi:hypothetical protein BKA64DRAFT_721576 [Cadophora sp. MPI-SDFR-AT-0126]|nr:hypothetical protein BKA64DRAFT_721576 [Leotiomycetes sp. MPI-SDFR-AT-0126]
MALVASTCLQGYIFAIANCGSFDNGQGSSGSQLPLGRVWKDVDGVGLSRQEEHEGRRAYQLVGASGTWRVLDPGLRSQSMVFERNRFLWGGIGFAHATTHGALMLMLTD